MLGTVGYPVVITGALSLLRIHIVSKATICGRDLLSKRSSQAHLFVWLHAGVPSCALVGSCANCWSCTSPQIIHSVRWDHWGEYFYFLLQSCVLFCSNVYLIWPLERVFLQTHEKNTGSRISGRHREWMSFVKLLCWTTSQSVWNQSLISILHSSFYCLYNSLLKSMVLLYLGVLGVGERREESSVTAVLKFCLFIKPHQLCVWDISRFALCFWHSMSLGSGFGIFL